MRNLFKVTLVLSVLYLLGCAAGRPYYDIEENLGTAAEAYKAKVLEEQRVRLGR